MWIAIASIISFFFGGLIATLLASLNKTSIQDMIQQLCSNCVDNKKRLLAKTIQRDIDWVEMCDDEITDVIMQNLYSPNPN